MCLAPVCGLLVLSAHASTLLHCCSRACQSLSNPTRQIPTKIFSRLAQCFEGMKAYVGVDGTVRMFRPEMNMNRMHNSMTRLALPGFDKAQWLDCIKELVKVDKDWIPKGEGYSLYLRPTGISTHVR